MQTFLPYKSMGQSVRCLDYKRLGKQRVEAFQILNALNNTMQKEKSYGAIVMPKWMGDETFHASHRSNLLKKDPEFYGKYGWTEATDLDYLWPVR